MHYHPLIETISRGGFKGDLRIYADVAIIEPKTIVRFQSHTMHIFDNGGMTS